MPRSPQSVLAVVVRRGGEERNVYIYKLVIVMLSESSCEKVDRTGLCQQLFIINSVSSDTHHTREGGREGMLREKAGSVRR